MALGRRYWSRASVILECDPAINLRESDYRAYMEAFDRSHLKLHDGVTPTIWEIRSLTYEQRKAVYAQGVGKNDMGGWELAIRCGLVGVDGYVCEDADTGQIIPTPPIEMVTDDLGKIVSRAWFAKMNFDADTLHGLVALIMTISEAKVKN